ncbi:LIC_12708 family protein [Sediminispirochaeta bajacaliforniensis]|uniref:LIC_12708 family protein n=1 Tax=Sediminispirochaeta bajacaliforniensis TaxID=148 RepID=UPI001FDEC542|nr:hypothetical protein [Sediminispirochaeta bajacaliforniensis]
MKAYRFPYYRCSAVCLFCFLVLFPLLFSSCEAGDGNTLKRETLFSLKIGKMEDDLDLVEHYGVPYTEKTRIVMRNGLFYIGNGNSKKVMEFNGYGDILSLFYSAETNPGPILLDTDSGSDMVSSRKAYQYPFTDVGEIAVTGSGLLLVEERAQEYQISCDEELASSLNTIVLRFSEDGEVLDYLGQEGVGGTPFPYVERIFVVDNDTIWIASRGPNRWVLFSFDNHGSLKSRSDIPPQEIPMPDGEGYAEPGIKGVFPDYTAPLLYVMVDYYRSEGDKGGIDFDQSAICIFNTETATWDSRIVLPAKRVDEQGGGFLEDDSFVTIYEALGVDRNGNLYFMAPESGDDFELMIMGRDGSVVDRSTILLEDDQIIYRDFYLSPDGILTALLAKAFGVDIVWWRSDRITEEE